MTAEVVLFWVFAVVGIGSAIAMVVMRNVVHAALMLVMSFFAVAGLFLVLQSAFLAVIQVIVYAGAIMVLFLFVLMLLGVSRDDLLVARSPAVRIAAWVLAVLLVVAVGFVFVGPFTGAGSVCGAGQDAAAAVEPTAGVIRCAGLEDRIGEDGSVAFAAAPLFTRYVFAFEFVALLLVVATIAALLVGRRRDPDEREVPTPVGAVPGTVGHVTAAGPATEPHSHGDAGASGEGPGGLGGSGPPEGGS